MEQTLAILKPDCVRKKIIGKVLARIEDNGFKVIGLKMIRLDRATAESFYNIHRGKSFFEKLIDFMTSGPCCIAILEKEDAIEDYRNLMGATDPDKARKNTIRYDFADNERENIVHGSDGPETAAKEIAFFYSTKELLQYR
jgi:nucleoside-diphosphate kinase